MSSLLRGLLCLVVMGVAACARKGGEVLFVIPDKFQGVIKLSESPDGIRTETRAGVLKLPIPPSGRLILKDATALRTWNKWSASYQNGESIPVLLGAALNEPGYGFFSLGSWGQVDWFFVGTRDEWKQLRDSRSFLDDRHQSVLKP